MGDQNQQRELLFPGNDDSAGDSQRRVQPPPRSITPGDWLSIEHEGQTVVGMIYRHEGEAYRFVYWDNLVLRFGNATRDRIGPWDEELTAIFRGQIAVIPHYVEQCVAAWVMLPEQRDRTNRVARAPDFPRGEPPKVQKRLFPE